MSRFLAMLIGVMMFAEALAVAEIWAKDVVMNPEKRTTRTKIFFMVFILFDFLLVYSCFLFCCLIDEAKFRQFTGADCKTNDLYLVGQWMKKL